MIKTTIGLLGIIFATISNLIVMFSIKCLNESIVIMIMLSILLMNVGVVLIIIDKVEDYEDEN